MGHDGRRLTGISEERVTGSFGHHRLVRKELTPEALALEVEPLWHNRFQPAEVSPDLRERDEPGPDRLASSGPARLQRPGPPPAARPASSGPARLTKGQVDCENFYYDFK